MWSVQNDAVDPAMGIENEKVRAGAAKKSLEAMVQMFNLYFSWRNLPFHLALIPI